MSVRSEQKRPRAYGLLRSRRMLALALASLHVMLPVFPAAGQDRVDTAVQRGEDTAEGTYVVGPPDRSPYGRELLAPPDPAPQSVAPPRLAEPTRDPLQIEISDDPIMQLLSETTSEDLFKSLVHQAVAYHPSVDEARAGQDEASAARREARSALFPTIDVGISNRTSLAREFSNDPDNIIERSRSTSRTDATFSVQQRVLDFGAASIRIDAAGARLRAAGFEIERQADQIALRAIAAWYDVYTYRALVALGDAFEVRQLGLRDSIQFRISQGVSAPADLAQIDSFIANNQTEQARNRRQLSNAEARFSELFDVPAPPGLGRAPVLGGRFSSIDAARVAALNNPVVDLVDAQTRAAQQDARAARAETLPTVNAGLEGGRFGVFDTGEDYDVRGTITLQHRFFGAADARADGARARANGAAARSDRVREEAVRMAAIAWTDVEALEEQFEAVSEAYVTTRQSRDVLLERFRVSRGTLFDVLDTERNYFSTATLYIQSATELDAARYVLLSRTGRLLDTLDINPIATLGGR